MNILLLKLILVPFFIGLMSLVAKKFGSKWAGLFGGMPVVGGPILIILAIENGMSFGANAALSGVSSAAAYICYGVTYCYMVRKFNWAVSMIAAIIAWAIVAFIIIELKPDLLASCIISFIIILTAEFILPKPETIKTNGVKNLYLPVRMIAGIALTLIVSALAHIAGSRLSGLLAVYPILGTIMLVSTHKMNGANEAIKLFRGMSRGAYSIIGFFGVLAYSLDKMHLGISILLALFAAFAIQAIVVMVFIKETKA